MLVGAHQCKKITHAADCPTQQTQPINMNGVKITQRWLGWCSGCSKTQWIIIMWGTAH